jgi:hypothetical protein
MRPLVDIPELTAADSVFTNLLDTSKDERVRKDTDVFGDFSNPALTLPDLF